eukprot:1379631-Ditylum_brightwellii.AAC.1
MGQITGPGKPYLKPPLYLQNNPNLSAYAYIFGKYDFNAHPLAPPGTHAIIHKKVGNRGSFDYHGINRWKIGPSLDHY